MALIKISKRIVMREVERVRRLDQQCLKSRNRFGFYVYLEAVLSLFETLKRSGPVKHWVEFIRTRYAVSHARQADLMRLLIEATSDADSKSKSRWARALRYIWKTTKTSSSVVEYLHANGGPTGCADKLAALKPTGVRRYVRFHTTGDRVPLIIHPDCYPRNRALHPE